MSRLSLKNMRLAVREASPVKHTFARRRRVLLRAIVPLLAALEAGTALGAPQGGQVVAGSAAISKSGNSLLIRQSTDRAIINWTDFSINPSETVRFALPSVSSAVLNRVTSFTPSELNGSLLSNGKVYLINPNGIVIGPSGRINVQSFTASSLDVNNASFLAGGGLLFSGSSTATVANQGVISTPGGDVVLIARQVRNDGQINAVGGSVTLATGTQVFLQQTAIPGMNVRVTGDGSASNSGVIQTTLAQLAANGGNAFALAINNTGVIRATGVQNVNGHIYLTGGATGAVNNSGMLNASSSSGTGGEIVVTGENITIAGQSSILATGENGGGEILIGGSWEGADAGIGEALSTTIDSGAVLDASAIQSGNGGTIVARADVTNPASFTRIGGSIFATGGALSGNGGRIETSGYSLDTTGAVVNASAANGIAGVWLLDPYNVTISSSATSGATVTGSPWVPTVSGGNIAASDINNALNAGTSVTISTGASGGDIGNITVSAAIAKSSGATAVTLTMDANNNIVINQPIGSTSGALNIVLDAQQGTSGAIIIGSNLTTNGGNISFGTGRTSGGVLIGGDVYLNGASAQTFSTSGGTVTVFGQMLIANSAGLTINTSGGTADFKSTIDSGDSYSLVSSNVTWDNALTLAKGATAGGAGVGDTYLATITSSLENVIAGSAANYQAAWLGGHRVLGVGTNAVWRWVAGPEGLQSGGNGLPFFTSNFTGGGGTAIGGAYTNWNGGEPNNSGGANVNVNGESAMQFVGTAGAWNDLPENSGSLPYLVETNLAASPLTVNAGAGQITFRGLIGGNKALASLTTTGPVAMNGGGATTTGAQTYNNPVALGSAATVLSVTNADLNIGQNITYSSSSAASLTLQSSGSVILASNTIIAGNVSGALNITIDTHNSAGTDSGNSGAIVLNSGASIQSDGGSITLGGGVTPGSTPAYGTATYTSGITLTNSTLNSGGGAITLDGSGITSGSVAGSGLLVTSGSVISSDAGSIAITGAGGAFVDASTPGSHGISLDAGTTISSTTNNVTLNGSSPAGLAGIFNYNTGTRDISAGGTLTLNPANDGASVGSTVLTASKLLLSGSGAFTMTNVSNLVGTLAANVAGGNVQLIDSEGLTIGSVGGTTGVSDSGGTITLVATGASSDITLSNLVSGVGSGSSVVLAAGRNFINNAGSSAITTGAGRFLVYSTSFGADTFGSLAGGDIYGKTYIANPPAGISATGNQFIFSAVPTLTFIANNETKIYGQANPTLGYLVVGLLGNDTVAEAVSGSPVLSTAAASAGVGNYAINVTSGSVTSSIGYALNFAPGILSVTPAPLSIAAVNTSKIYGAALPAFSATYTGLVNGDTAIAISGLSFTAGGTAASNVGVYSLTPHGATSPNYNISFVAGSLSINKAPLAITADNKMRPLEQANPTLTDTFSGLVNGDLSSTVTGIVLTTPAKATSPIGYYPIDISGGSSGNYSITLVNGTLQVTDIFAQDIRTAAQLAQTLAPNFPPELMTPQTGAPTASQTVQVPTTPEVGVVQLGKAHGYIFYRDVAPMPIDNEGELSIGPDGILIDAIAHVSSFDLGPSKFARPTVANDLP
ncbi:MAG TPA: MBG domain-containing protein [Tepidisphaeraceae bacterium]